MSPKLCRCGHRVLYSDSVQLLLPADVAFLLKRPTVRWIRYYQIPCPPIKLAVSRRDKQVDGIHYESNGSETSPCYSLRNQTSSIFKKNCLDQGFDQYILALATIHFEKNAGSHGNGHSSVSSNEEKIAKVEIIWHHFYRMWHDALSWVVETILNSSMKGTR